MIWATLFVMLVIVAFIAVRMSAKHEEQGLHDTGLAIIEFNRAFPTEAIRSLQAAGLEVTGVGQADGVETAGHGNMAADGVAELLAGHPFRVSRDAPPPVSGS